jgi:predicted dehydrogenase
MTQRPFRAGSTVPSVALCGAGMISDAHGLAARFAGFPVVAVASRTHENAVAKADRHGGRAVAYADLPAGADIVVVVTPPALHASQALALLGAGAAVLLEKPLCTTLAEADALVAAAAAHGQRLLYAENLAYAPVVAELLTHVPFLGRPHHVEVRAVQAKPEWGGFFGDDWGGGALFDLGVHPVAVALLLAAPARVVAVSARLEGSDGHGTDEHADVVLRFDSGLRAHVVSSWRGGPEPLWDAQVASASGVLRAELLPRPSLERNGTQVHLAPPTAPVPQIEQYGYLGQLRAFADDLAGGRTPMMSAAFGRLVLDVVCAAYASAGAGGAEEAVPFTGPRDRTPLQLWRGV